MKLEYQVTEQDLKHFALWVLDEVGPSEGTPRRMGYVGAPIVGGLALFLVRPESALGMFTAVIGGMLAWILWWSSIQGQTRRKVLEAYLQGDSGKSATGFHVLTIDHSGLHEARPQGEIRHSWPAVRRVVQHKGAVYIMIGAESGYIIPGSALADGAGADALVREVQTFRGTARQ